MRSEIVIYYARSDSCLFPEGIGGQIEEIWLNLLLGDKLWTYFSEKKRGVAIPTRPSQ